MNLRKHLQPFRTAAALRRRIIADAQTAFDIERARVMHDIRESLEANGTRLRGILDGNTKREHR